MQTYVLLGALALASGLYLWTRTNSGQSALSSATDYLGNLMSTRGIRNNNPGNVERSAIRWQGSLTQQQVESRGWTWDETFEQMDAPANGVRMIGHVLRSKASRGLVTVDAIIRDYSKTDQDAYVRNVTAALGLDPDNGGADQVIDVEGSLPTLATAIIQQENGQQPYDPADIAQWVYS